MADFAYLHAHSEYSLTDGCLSVEEYVRTLEQFGVSRAALTDTHNLFGAVKFVEAAQQAGIEPLVGVELIVRSSQGTGWGRSRASRRLRVYVEDRRGYSTLCSRLSESYRRRHKDGLYVGIDELADDPEGLLFLGPPGPGADQPLPRMEEASFRDQVEEFAQTFGDRAGVEVPVYAEMDDLERRLVDVDTSERQEE